MEYNRSTWEKEDGCRWSFCISSDSRGSSKQFNDQRGVQLSYDQPPSPVSPIAYMAPARRPVTSTSQHMRDETKHKSWFQQDPYGRPREHKPRQSRSSSFSVIKRSFTSSRGRPSIGAPTDFRKLTNTIPEPVPARRRSFRPLELSIYVEPSGRLSPLPDFLSDDWEFKIPGLDKPPQALLRRETVDNSLLHGEFTVPRKPLSTYSQYNPRRAVVSEPFLLSVEDGPGPVIDYQHSDAGTSMSDLGTIDEDRTPTLPVAQMDDLAKSALRSGNQRRNGYTVTTVQSQPPMTRHSRSEGGNRSSKGSFRRSKDEAVEEAIQELNTIVEAKRHRAKLSSVGSPPLSPTSHVPAIAPSMTVRARSKTLTDIGSAFSTSVSKPLPAGSSPSMASSRTFTRSPLPGPRLTITETPSGSAESSATALPQMPAPMPAQSSTPMPNPLQSNPVRPTVTRKDRLSTWLKRVSNASSEAMPPQTFYQLTSKDLGVDHSLHHTRSSASLDTVSTFSTAGSTETSDTTPATAASTASPTTPSYEMSRPSFSKTPRNLRRQPKRGLSIDTTLSNGSRTVPPAYHELDPHPHPLTPSRIGVAC